MKKLLIIIALVAGILCGSFALSGLTDLANVAAIASAYNFKCNSTLEAGDVVVWDSTLAYAVKTSTAANSQDVAGIAVTSGDAGDEIYIRFTGGRVLISVTGSVAKGDYLYTSTESGKAQASATLSPGAFARAITVHDVPTTGKCYAELMLGLQDGSAETNTASNQGVDGVGPFDTKSGVDLQFRNINAASSKVTVTHDSGNKEIDIDINEGNITHDNLSGAGTNTHAQIDTHIADAGKHREINDSGTGATDLWSAEKIGGIVHLTVDSSFPSSPSEGELFYHTTHNTLFQYDGSNWRPLKSYGSLTLYVDGGSGSDAVGKGYGSGSDAAATIQWLWDNCIPVQVGGAITVNVTGDTYSEALVFQGKNMASSDASITFVGALTNSTSGTATSGTTTTLTKSGAGWTGGAYAGMICRITAGTNSGDALWIGGNSSDTLTFGGAFNSAIDATSQFSIDSIATTISPGAGNTGITLQNGQLGVTLENVKISGGQIGIYLCRNSTLTGEIIHCTTQTQYGVHAHDYASATLYYSFMENIGVAGLRANIKSYIFAAKSYIFSAAYYGIENRGDSYTYFNRSFIGGDSKDTDIGAYTYERSILTFYECYIYDCTTGTKTYNMSLGKGAASSVTYTSCTTNEDVDASSVHD